MLYPLHEKSIAIWKKFKYKLAHLTKMPPITIRKIENNEINQRLKFIQKKILCIAQCGNSGISVSLKFLREISVGISEAMKVLAFKLVKWQF